MQDVFTKVGEESRVVELNNGVPEVTSKEAREEGESESLKKQLIQLIMWNAVLCMSYFLLNYFVQNVAIIRMLFRFMKCPNIFL